MEKPIRFVGKGDQFIPQLYGIDSIQPILAETTNIKLLEPKKNQSELVIQGVARVFEAVVQYEMLDSAGKSQAQGFTQAAVAGGDWGYFTIKIPLSDLKNKQIQKVQLYTTSPKDGRTGLYRWISGDMLNETVDHTEDRLRVFMRCDFK